MYRRRSRRRPEVIYEKVLLLFFALEIALFEREPISIIFLFNIIREGKGHKGK